LYIDPPYLGLSKTAQFNGYNSEIFGRNNQKELADYCNVLAQKGCYLIISNHWHDDILSWYSNELFEKYPIAVGRTINSKSDQRKKKVSEVLFISRIVK